MISAGEAVQDAHDGLGRDALAGAGLAEDRAGLPLVQHEVHAVDCMSPSGRRVELHVQVTHLQRGCAHVQLREEPRRRLELDGVSVVIRSPHLRVEGIAQRITHEDEAEHGADEQNHGENEQPRGLQEVNLVRRDHDPPRLLRRLEADTEEGPASPRKLPR